MRRLRNMENTTTPIQKDYDAPISYQCQECRYKFSTTRPACKVRCPGCGSKYVSIANLNGNTKI